jgi:CRISPR-associated endonuclease/helicase Cas3
LLWRGPESEATRVVGAGEIRPGDTIVVPSEYGGADEFGWAPLSTEPVSDVGDLCVNDMANSAPAGRRLIRVRLHPTFINHMEEGERPLGGMVSVVRELAEQGESSEEALDELLAALTSRSLPDPLTVAAITEMGRVKSRVTVYPSGIVLTARVRAGFYRPQAVREGPPDDSEADDISSQQPKQVSLEHHTQGVVRWTESFTSSLGLESECAAALAQAAQFHDIGKADWRFQYLLHGDVPGDTLLAKSGRDFDARQNEGVRRLSGLPRRFRHEFVSVALLRNHRERGTEAPARLVEYLVGTHHGRGRPFVPVTAETEPEEVVVHWDRRTFSASSDHRLWHLEGGWTDDFWTLVRRYGYWGLAYLETILRLADAARSAEEQDE